MQTISIGLIIVFFGVFVNSIINKPQFEYKKIGEVLLIISSALIFAGGWLTLLLIYIIIEPAIITTLFVLPLVSVFMLFFLAESIRISEILRAEYHR